MGLRQKLLHYGALSAGLLMVPPSGNIYALGILGYHYLATAFTLKPLVADLIGKFEQSLPIGRGVNRFHRCDYLIVCRTLNPWEILVGFGELVRIFPEINEYGEGAGAEVSDYDV